MDKHRLLELAETRWNGKGELWLDPEGNQVTLYDCHLHISDDAVSYSWIYEGESKEGNFTFNENGANWVDSWHQPETVECEDVTDAWGLFTLSNTYEVPENPSWGWRSKLSERPDGMLVLQMTNIAPWGEEGRAVRMVFSQDS